MAVLKTIGLIVLLIIVFLMWSEGGLSIIKHILIGGCAYAIYFASILLETPLWYKVAICLATLVGTIFYISQLKDLIARKLERKAFGYIRSHNKNVGNLADVAWIFIPSSLKKKAVGYTSSYVISRYIGWGKWLLICILALAFYLLLLCMPFIVNYMGA